MVYPEEIKGRFVTLKSVTLEDVEFSYNIRAEEKNRETVGQVAGSIEEQRKFIEWQMKEPGDYYFVVYNKKGEKIGLIGVYDIHGDTGEFGREVNDGSAVEAMEAEVLLGDFAMDVLGLKKSCAVIYANNRKHLKNQEKMGVYPVKKSVRSGVDCFYYENELTKNNKQRKLLSRIPDDYLD